MGIATSTIVRTLRLDHRGCPNGAFPSHRVDLSPDLLLAQPIRSARPRALLHAPYYRGKPSSAVGAQHFGLIQSEADHQSDRRTAPGEGDGL